MAEILYQKKTKTWRKCIASFVAFTFFLSLVSGANAQYITNLPKPGEMVLLSPAFQPPVLKGMTLHPENPLQFDFIVDRGQDKLSGDALKAETEKLLKYFLAAMTIPDKDSWVNLSPYEGDRIVPDMLGSTDMGKAMLEQDYLLKQLSASLTNPQEEIGKKFWNTVYKKAFEKFGTTTIPINTFNKVWIIPDKAIILEDSGYAYIGETHLKVMLDEDYTSIKENLKNKKLGTDQIAQNKVEELSSVSSDVVREIIIPELEKEINQGKNFAQVRQIYNSVILATWYKQTLKDSLLGRIYVDKNKILGVDIAEKDIKQKVYEQYLAAFRKGVYNLIKEDYDLASKETLPRKYFSGGFAWEGTASAMQRLPMRGSSAVELIRRENLEAKFGNSVSVMAFVAEKEKEAETIAAQVRAKQQAQENNSRFVQRLLADPDAFDQFVDFYVSIPQTSLLIELRAKVDGAGPLVRGVLRTILEKYSGKSDKVAIDGFVGELLAINGKLSEAAKTKSAGASSALVAKVEQIIPESVAEVNADSENVESVKKASSAVSSSNPMLDQWINPNDFIKSKLVPSLQALGLLKNLTDAMKAHDLAVENGKTAAAKKNGADVKKYKDLEKASWDEVQRILVQYNNRIAKQGEVYKNWVAAPVQKLTDLLRSGRRGVSYKDQAKQAELNGEQAIFAIAGGLSSRMDPVRRVMQKVGLSNSGIWDIDLTAMVRRVQAVSFAESDFGADKDAWNAYNAIGTLKLAEGMEEYTVGDYIMWATMKGVEDQFSDPKEQNQVRRNKKILIFVNETILPKMLEGFSKHNAYGFDYKNVIFASLGYRDSFVVDDKGYLAPSGYLVTANHGASFQEALMGESGFRYNPDTKQIINLKGSIKDELKTLGVKAYLARRTNDAMLFIPKGGAYDLDSFSALYAAQDRFGANMVAEVMENSVGAKGGLALANKGDSQPFMQLWEGNESDTPEVAAKVTELVADPAKRPYYNRFYFAGLLDDTIQALENNGGLDLILKAKKNSQSGKIEVSPEVPAGQVTRLGGNKTLGFIRSDLFHASGVYSETDSSKQANNQNRDFKDAKTLVWISAAFNFVHNRYGDIGGDGQNLNYKDIGKLDAVLWSELVGERKQQVDASRISQATGLAADNVIDLLMRVGFQRKSALEPNAFIPTAQYLTLLQQLSLGESNPFSSDNQGSAGASSAVTASIAGKRILLVEDDEMAAIITEDALRGVGQVKDVKHVSSGEEALALLRNNPGQYDLVITDNTLKGGEGTLTGLALVNQMDAEGINIPTVFASTDFDQPNSLESQVLADLMVKNPFVKGNLGKIASAEKVGELAITYAAAIAPLSSFGKGQTVLVVDSYESPNENLFKEQYTAALQTAGFNVRFAYNREEAERLVKAGEVDLLIAAQRVMDSYNNEQNAGLELIKTLGQEVQNGLPVVLIKTDTLPADEGAKLARPGISVIDRVKTNSQVALLTAAKSAIDAMAVSRGIGKVLSAVDVRKAIVPAGLSTIGAGKTVLVVETTEDATGKYNFWSRNYRTSLEAAGFEVLFTGDRFEAIKMINDPANAIGLLVLSQSLKDSRPNENNAGFDVLNGIGKDEDGRAIADALPAPPMVFIQDSIISGDQNSELQAKQIPVITRALSNDPVQLLLSAQTAMKASSTLRQTKVQQPATSISTGTPVGGIDFDPSLLNLQIKRNGKGVPLPLPQQNIEKINIDGLYPVIINIQPATIQNFPFLSSAENDDKVPELSMR